MPTVKLLIDSSGCTALSAKNTDQEKQQRKMDDTAKDIDEDVATSWPDLPLCVWVSALRIYFHRRGTDLILISFVFSQPKSCSNGVAVARWLLQVSKSQQGRHTLALKNLGSTGLRGSAGLSGNAGHVGNTCHTGLLLVGWADWLPISFQLGRG